MNQMNQEELLNALQVLFNQDLRYEVLIRTVVEILSTKKNADGSPLLTLEEFNTRAEAIKAEMIKSAREAAAKPAIIVPASAVPEPAAGIPPKA